MSQSAQREEAVFEAALQLPADQRAAYLDQACAGDADLRRRVEVLLGAFERAGGFMKQPATPVSSRTVAVSLPPTEKPGDRIGRFKLLEQIGEGGCGVVYMAEQTEPVRRRVALKVIKLGMDTKQVIARFEAERQALALMDHPNIAKIFDAGVTEAPLPASSHPLPVRRGEGQGEGSANSQPSTLNPQLSSGRPYFVMELVKGIRITDYCDQNHLATPERLALFTQVCQAIQHAHQKGIIHRDIKPSNILVTLHDGVPVPKVIDFGIAKATEQPLTEKTVFTAFGQFMGTPAYMSPEQAELSGLDIDTRSDIYALGVLLYELLTGRTPFDAKELLQAGLDEMRRRIREEEPMRPSTRLSTMADADLTEVAQQRHSEPAKLTRFIRGDLDWIVMKCLEKDRTRRYETANGLAADIRRHLENEPVVACPPSAGYRFQKLVRRNKLAFAAVSAVAAALVIGLGIAAWQFVEKSRAYDRAVQADKKSQTEAAKSQQVAKFLKEMLLAAGPSVARGRDATILREILEKTSERVEKETKDQPEVQGDIWLTLGSAYWDMGDHPRAITNFEKAVASYRLAFHGDHKNLALALAYLGSCQSFTGDITNGHYNAGLGLQMARQCGDTEVLIRCLRNFAHTFTSFGMTSSEAAPYVREALELGKKQEGKGDPVHMATIMMDLARTSTNNAEAQKHVQDAVALYRQHLPPDHPTLVGALFELGQNLLFTGQFAEAEQALREAHQGFQKIHRPDQPYQSIVLRFLAESLLVRGKGDEAEAVVRQQLAATPTHAGHLDLLRLVIAFRRDWPPDDEILQYLKCDFLHWDLTDRFAKADDQAEVERLFREGLRKQRERYGPENLNLTGPIRRLADLCVRQGKMAEAETLYREALSIAQKLPPGEDRDTQLGWSRQFLVKVLKQQDKLAEADVVIEEAPPQVRWPIYGRAGRWNEAAASLRQSIESEPDNSVPYLRLAPVLLLIGDEDGYRQLCRRMVAQFSGTINIGTADTVAKGCSIHPRSGVDLRAVAKAAETAVTMGKESENFPWFALCKSMAEYRQEHFAGAAEWAQKSLAAAGQLRERDAAADLVLAMAQMKLKRTTAARDAFDRGASIVEQKLPKLDSGDLGAQWHDVVIANLLLREAKTLIEGKGTPGVDASKADP